MPSLVYNDYTQAYKASVILKEWKFGGMKRLLSRLTREFTQRAISYAEDKGRALTKVAPNSRRSAIVLGSEKMIAWEDETFELQCYGKFLRKVVPAYDNPALIEALKEAFWLLHILGDPPDSPEEPRSPLAGDLVMKDDRMTHRHIPY